MQSFEQRMQHFFDTLWPAESKRLVLGEGKRDHPPVALIGEAPGEQETLQGRPFVGKAGKNLDGFLDVVELRREDIYITNVVKVRPTKVSAKGTVSNRPPNREELALFTPYLMEELTLVAPELIVTLGNVPLRALTGPTSVIGQLHGQVMAADIRHGGTARKIPLFPLYHPASVIYDQTLKAVYAQDLQALRTYLGK